MKLLILISLAFIMGCAAKPVIHDTPAATAVTQLPECDRDSGVYDVPKCLDSLGLKQH
jgi:uncharacterized lipoprotein YajG